MGFTSDGTPEPTVIRRAGTAYLVKEVYDSEKAEQQAVVPVNVPQPGGKIQINAAFTDEQLAEIVLRACRMDPGYEALIELVEDMEPNVVAFYTGPPFVIEVEYEL